MKREYGTALFFRRRSMILPLCLQNNIENNHRGKRRRAFYARCPGDFYVINGFIGTVLATRIFTVQGG